MQENLFLLDSDKTILGVLSNRMPFSLSFTEDLQERSLDDFTDTLVFKIPANHSLSPQVKAERYILYPENNGGQKLYKIMEVNEVSSDGIYTREVYAEISAQDDLLKTIVRPMQFTSATLREVLDYVLTGTEWEVGDIDNFGLLDYQIDDYPTALDAVISAIQEFGGELNFEYETLNNSASIVSQKVSAYKQLGERTNKIFTNGKDLKGVERFEDTTKLVTAMIGVGKSDDSGIPMNFKTTNLTIPSGYEKPFEADWVSSVKALEDYSSDGKHTFGVYRDDNAESPHELFKRTLEALKKYEKPLVTYKVDIALLERVTGYEHMAVNIGDSIVVQDKTVSPELYVNARVRKISRSLTDPSADSVELGDYIPVIPSTNKQITDLQAKIRTSEATWTEARKIAEEAKVTATEADSKATVADGKATTAQTTADTAKGTADTAQTTADTAKGTADTAKATADEAKGTADTVAGQIVTVEAELADKVAQAEYNTKMAEINTELEGKTGFTYVDGQLVAKADKTAVDAITEDLMNKADLEYVNGQLVSKADSSELDAINNSLADKADLTYVNGQLVAKADKESTFTKTEVNNALAGKVSTTTYTTDQNAIVTRLSDAETAIEQNESQIALKASKTELDAIEGRVSNAESSLTVQAGQIASKVSQTDFNTLDGRVDSAESSITQQATQIASKVAKTDFDSLTGRVSNAETTITQQAGQIASKVSQTDFNSLTNRVGSAESSITQQAGQIASKVESSTFTDYKKESGTGSSWMLSENKSLVTAGWYRIAMNRGDRAYAKFILKDIKSGKHTTAVFNAGIHYGNSAQLALLGFSSYGTPAFNKVRFVKKSTYDPVYLEVYIADGVMSVWCTENIQQNGWEAVEYLEGSIPEGYTAIEFPISSQYVADATGQNTAKDTANVNGVPSNTITTDLSSAKSSITQLDNQIKSKVSTTDFNSLSGRVSTAESTITQHSNQIASKVSTTDFNSLTGRVSTAESTITQQAGQISSRVEKNKVVSEINQSSETIKISASKIDIQGAVTFSSFDTTTQGKINGIESTANTAKSTADSATTKANTAQSTANTANSTASSVKTLTDNWKHSSDTTKIDGGEIYTNSITATQINVGTLSALTANLGTVTAGTVTGVSFASKPVVITDNIGRKWTEKTEIGINGVGFRTTALVQTSTNGGKYADQETQIDSDGVLISTRDDSTGLYSYTSMSGASIQFGGKTSNLASVGQHFINGDGQLTVESQNSLTLQSFKDDVVIAPASGSYIRLNGTVRSNSIVSQGTLEGSYVKGTIEHTGSYFVINPYSSSYLGNWKYGQLFYDGVENSWKFNSRQVSNSLSTTKLVAGGFETSSSIQYKENIQDFSVDALEVINGLSVHSYNYIGSDATDRKIGLIIEDGVPEPISNKTGDAVDTYAMASYLWKAVQQLSQQVKYQQESIDYLSQQLESQSPETV